MRLGRGVSRRQHIRLTAGIAALAVAIGLIGGADYARTEPTMVVFLAAWCKYSAYTARYILPSLTLAENRHGVRVVPVLEEGAALVADPGPFGLPSEGRDGITDSAHLMPSTGSVRAFVAQARLAVPLVEDSAGYWRVKAGPYYSASYPEFVTFDSDWRVKDTAVGVQSVTVLTDLH